MTPRARLMTAAAVTALALAGCTNMNGTPNQPGTGALIGGVTGAAIGNAIGNDTNSTIVGGAVGAVIGGAIGTEMQEQERELSAALAGSGAVVSNDGSRLHVMLPESVTFPTDSSVVNPGFYAALANVSASLRRHPRSSVHVAGHTDSVGAEAYNQQLSTDRALSVARILIADGVPTGRVTYAGQGENQPIASNATSSGRAQNRRVEIIITPTR